MNHLRTVLSTLGGIFLAALLIATLAPKAARAVATALVQVANTRSAPVPVDAVRQSASNFINLNTSGTGNSPATTWTQLFPDGSIVATPFALPAGEELVVTDVTVIAVCFSPSCPPAGTQASVVIPTGEGFSQGGPFYYATSMNYQSTEGNNLFAVHTDHLAGGIVFSKLPVVWFNINSGNDAGESFSVTIQGYLAP